MKKNALIIVLLGCICCLSSLFSQTTDSGVTNGLINAFDVDIGVSLNCGLFTSSPPGLFNDEPAIVASITSFRIGFDTTLLFPINEKIFIGPNIGCNFLKSVYNNKDYFYAEIPLRFVAKMGGKSTFVQPYAGYYICATSYLPSGFEIGSRFALVKGFIDASAIIGDVVWYRFGLGITLNTPI